MGRRYDDDELHWYALDVTRQKEFVAGYIFNKRGWMTFIPTKTKFRKKNRYTKAKGLEAAYAAIPGTVFVGFPHPPQWYEVMRIHLVNGFLSIDDRPRRLDTASPEWIRYRAQELDGQLVLEKQIVMHQGAEVEQSAALVHVQGRGVVRAPWSMKSAASSHRPVVIPVTGTRAEKMKGLFGAAVDWKATAA